jgi:folate-binding Fe-S cluster repair protein YgfZ
LPAEIGLRDELLSFDKGCYLGQESIHRIDVLGDVKRKLVGVRVPGASDLRPGAPVTADGAVVGELTSPTLLPNGDLVGLAVVKRPYDTPGTAVRAGEHPARIESLPFRADGG